MMERDDIKLSDSTKAMRLKLTCEKGECEEKIQKNGKIIKQNCKFKPPIKDFENNTFEGTVCPYYDQKYTALISNHSLWNYYSYFQIMKYNQNVYGEYLGRKIAIFDEAHQIENQIIQFVGIDIYKNNIEECGLDIKSYDLTDIDVISSLLDDMAEYYARQVKDLRDSRAFQSNPNYARLSDLDRKYERFTNARGEIESNKANFIINNPDIRDDQFSSVSIKPLDVSKHVQEFFNTSFQVFMSATIDKDSFCENMGIPLSEIDIVDTPKSPFDIKNREIKFLNIKSLSRRSSNEDELLVIKKIDEILSNHKDQRGIILTSSKNRCYEIQKNLSAKNKERIRICHTRNQGGKTQDEILKEHSQIKNSVLLSSSLWEGIDLKDDLSRFQIVAKVPYANFSEKRVAVKKEKFPLWYNSQTLTKLLQGFGRSIRNENDWAVTYVLDSAVDYLLSKSQKLVPKAYYDVLGWKMN